MHSAIVTLVCTPKTCMLRSCKLHDSFDSCVIALTVVILILYDFQMCRVG